MGVVTLRLIDGEKLMRELYDDYERNDMFYPEYHSEALRIVGNTVKSQPTVDAVPVKHGRWKLVDEAEPLRYGCSECSCLSWYGTYKYCPNCGAKMDGGVGNAAD